MTKQIYQSHAFNGNQLIDFRVENLASNPSAGSAGRIIFNTTTGKFMADDGSGLAVLSSAWADITGKPSTFAPSAHNHALADITGLVSALADKAALASPTFTGNPTAPTQTVGNNTTRLATTAFVTAAVGAAGGGDMLKSVYDSQDNGTVDAARAAPWSGITGKPSTFTPSAHNHAIADVTSLQSTLDGKSNTGHSHAIADVTSLQATLDGKANTSHTHTSSQITDFATAVNTQVAAYWDTIAGGDNNADTIRETLDIILANAATLQDQIARYNALIGDGSSTSIAVTHSLNSLDVTVEVYEIASGATVGVDVVRTSANVVTIGANPALASGSHRIVVKK